MHSYFRAVSFMTLAGGPLLVAASLAIPLAFGRGRTWNERARDKPLPWTLAVMTLAVVSHAAIVALVSHLNDFLFLHRSNPLLFLFGWAAALYSFLSFAATIWPPYILNSLGIPFDVRMGRNIPTLLLLLAPSVQGLLLIRAALAFRASRFRKAQADRSS